MIFRVLEAMEKQAARTPIPMPILPPALLNKLTSSQIEQLNQAAANIINRQMADAALGDQPWLQLVQESLEEDIEEV